LEKYEFSGTHGDPYKRKGRAKLEDVPAPRRAKLPPDNSTGGSLID